MIVSICGGYCGVCCCVVIGCMLMNCVSVI